MAQSATSNKAWNVLSYQDAIWQISWGETSTISELRAEMSAIMKQDSWQSSKSWQNAGTSWKDQMQSQQQGQRLVGNSAGLQLVPGFKTLGLMMTRIAGTQCQMPALVLAAPIQAEPVTNDNAACEPRISPATKLSSTSESFSPQKYDRSTSNAAARNSPDSGSQARTGPSDDADTRGPAVTLETFDGELPSVGSEGHFDGSCKRCAFFSKGRCKNGKDCSHCHFSHELRPRTRKRNARRQAFTEEVIVEEEIVSSQGIAFGDFGSDDSALSEVLSYLSEPERTPEKANNANDDMKGEEMIVKLNNAIQQASDTYVMDLGDRAACNDKLGDKRDAPTKYAHIADAETTSSSVSSYSDGEDTANMSFGDSREGNSQASKSMLEPEAQTDTSDSEVASQQDPTSVPILPLSPSQQKSQEATNLEHPSTEDIRRMIRSLLNKLTHERFESLCSKILALPLSTDEQLAVVVAEIFLKATTQDCFRTLYTDLCMRLDAHLASQSGSTGGKAFRKALVNECQVTFERNLKPIDASLFTGLDDEERFEAEMKLKTRRLGNMRFIGDLLVRRLLAAKLLPPIMHELLHSDEAALESAIALLTIVAPEFEMKPSLYQAPVRDALSTLRRKVNDKSVSTRVRCQISDLLDAKARAWAPRSRTSER